MAKLIDLTGQRVGKWAVLQRVNKGKWGQVLRNGAGPVGISYYLN